MKGDNGLRDILGDSLEAVLEKLDEAILLLDDQRTLRYVNDHARRLLGYEEGQSIGGRCRLTTRGVDCSNACPLTFALEGEMEAVERFSTVYRSQDDRPVPLEVTVIPLRDADGAFTGALEILHAVDPDPGFFAAGRGEGSRLLRQEIARIAASGRHVVLVGELPACADVAATVHRGSGLADTLFERWQGSWDTVATWPPGTLYAHSADGITALESEPPEGWRVIVGVTSADEAKARSVVPVEALVLPELADRSEDLPMILAAWVEQMAPSLKVTPDALARLCRLAGARGLAALQPILATAVSAADSVLDDCHIPAQGVMTIVVDELLRCEAPLAALEEHLLREVLERSTWRMQEAADQLGVSRVTLWRKLKEHGIER